MEQSPRLSLPYVQPQQAQKHVTVNEGLRKLDAVVQLSVLSAGVTAEPAEPEDGDRYIVPAGATGAAWETMTTGAIAYYVDGAWMQISPREGWLCWDANDEVLLVWTDDDWAEISAGGGGSETAEKFGVNTTADTTNRLAVKSDAALFHHDDVTPGSGDMRIVCNKAGAGDTASFLFQTDDDGRAEFGLIGDEDFRLKVSDDGDNWTDALVVDRSTGFAGVGAIEPRGPLAVLGRSDGWALHFSASDVDSGGYLTSISASNFFMSEGASYEGGAWIAKAATAAIIGGAGAAIFLYANSGLTAGNSFTPTARMRVDANEVSPGGDNAQSAGAASRRYTEVFAVNGAINTSDAREKEIDGGLDAAERRAARRLLAGVVKYRWREAVARKGSGARTHIGFTAQDVAAAFAAEGLDAARYGLWCEDEVSETVQGDAGEEIDRKTGETVQGLRYAELFAFLIATMAEDRA